METVSRFSVYLIRCNDGSLYAGITTDLERRLREHNAGRGAAYTRSRRPVRLVYDEPAGDRSTALRREAALRRLDRREKLALVRGAKRPRPRDRQRKDRKDPAGSRPDTLRVDD
jgi:putative endonuclease